MGVSGVCVYVWVPRKLVTNHLDVDIFAELEPDVANKVLIDPRLKFTHPNKVSQLASHRVQLKGTYHRVVLLPSVALPLPEGGPLPLL